MLDSKHLIYFNDYLRKNSGGPAGYLWNLKKGLDDNQLGSSIHFISLSAPHAQIYVPFFKKYLKHHANYLFRYYRTYFDKEFRWWWQTTLKQLQNYRELMPGTSPDKIFFLSHALSIHVHTTLDAVKIHNILLRMGRRKDVKLLLTSHCPEAPGEECRQHFRNEGLLSWQANKIGSAYQTIDVEAFKIADILIFPCREAMEPYFNAFSLFPEIVREKDIRFVLTGTAPLEPLHSKNDIRKKLGLEDKFTVSYIGRHNAIKGYDSLKGIGRYLLDKESDVAFLIGGHQEPMSGINHPHWIELGWTPDPGSLITASDVFVLPNQQTFFDLVLLEALSSGTPIVASRTGGHKILDGQSQGLILYDTFEECVNAIQTIKKASTSEHEAMGNANKALYKESFTQQSFAKNYYALMEGIYKDYNLGKFSPTSYTEFKPAAAINSALSKSDLGKPIAEYQPLPSVPSTIFPRKICIVTSEIAGPAINGGVGTACEALSTALAADGHQVTVLSLQKRSPDNHTNEYWTEYYRKKKVVLVPLRSYDELNISSPYYLRRPYEAYLWLKENGQDFDIIFYTDYYGIGYYISLAKHQGISFSNTQLCAWVHSPTLWMKQANEVFPITMENLCHDFMERQSIANADMLVSPSQYMIDWMRKENWTLPKNVYVKQNFISQIRLLEFEEKQRNFRKIKEVVFFGRLERRKGYELFCDAIDKLAADKLDVRITFLGKNFSSPNGNSIDYIRNRVAKWPFKWQILSNKSHAEALCYLKQNSCIAVIPSLNENSPYTVLECLQTRIPFICSDVGGIPELIAEKDRKKVCFDPLPSILANKICAVLQGGIEIASPEHDNMANRNSWLGWLRSFEKPPPKHINIKMPLVSICISHVDDPIALERLLISIVTQDYSNYEIVLVDRGSASFESKTLLAELAAEFSIRKWPLIRQERPSRATSYNLAVQNARGEYVKIMDTGCFSKPQELSIFMHTALTTNADILSCFVDMCWGSELLEENHPHAERRLFVDHSLAIIAQQNCFCESNLLVKKNTFLSLGGFAENLEEEQLHQEFVTRAMLNGFHFEMIPEPLFWKRPVCNQSTT